MFWNRAVSTAILTILTSLNVLCSIVEAQPTGEIIVRVVGLKSNKGEVRFGLYDNAKAFDQGAGHAIVKGTCPIKENQCEFTIPNVPYYTYAIMIGHDVNKDGKISKNPFSEELKGISNYTKKLWWFPDFNKAKFEHNKVQTVLEIRIY